MGTDITGAFAAHLSASMCPLGAAIRSKEVALGQVRRPVRIAVPDRLPLGDGLLGTRRVESGSKAMISF